MKAEALVHANVALRKQALWKLLAADNGPVVLGLLEAHLLEEERVLAASVFHAKVADDLKTLSNAGINIDQSAEKLVYLWLQSGYLIRRLPAGAKEEEYELSLEAVSAIRMLKNIRSPHPSATESRLSRVNTMILDLARATHPTPEATLDALQNERARIDDEIEQVLAGRWQPMARERAIEAMKDILQDAGELVADFRRVRDRFELLHRQMREQVLQSDEGRGEVLEILFRGVDMIAESDEGKTFESFYMMLIDQASSSAFDDAIQQLLSRDFVDLLTLDERRALRSLRHEMLLQAQSVHEVMAGFGRSLKDFVRSTEFKELKRLNYLITEAERGAVQIKDMLKPHSKIGMSLELTSAEIRSMGSWKIRSPEHSYSGKTMKRVESDMTDDEVAAVFLHGEIDMASLEEDIDKTLDQMENPTIADVLRLYPSEQGWGGVVGLVAIAKKRGATFVGGEQDRVYWLGLDQVQREGNVPRVYFGRGEEIQDAE